VPTRRQGSQSYVPGVGAAHPGTVPIDALTGLQRYTFRGDCTDVNEWDLVAKRIPD
jgi:hypothetical protein